MLSRRRLSPEKKFFENLFLMFIINRKAICVTSENAARRIISWNDGCDAFEILAEPIANKSSTK